MNVAHSCTFVRSFGGFAESQQDRDIKGVNVGKAGVVVLGR